MTALFCPYCKAEREVEVQEGKETFNVKGDEISVISKVAVCRHCGKKILDEGLESSNLERVYETYRKNHSLLSPDAIRQIREKYGLSQRALAKFLEWGEVTIHRYENGAIQDSAHDKVLRFIDVPGNMKYLFERNRNPLSETTESELGRRIGALLRGKAEAEYEDALIKLLDVGEPCQLNGFKRFDLQAMEHSILFFAERVKHVFPSKITKLLWYADFLCYKTTARSITGSQYLAAEYGPVPNGFRSLFALMDRKGLIRLQEVAFPSMGKTQTVTGERIHPLHLFDKSVFSGPEYDCLKCVAQEFRDCTARSTEKRAHNEKAYKEVHEPQAPWKPISYYLAETLSL
jgi:putative zinc finger/helix-turn-helix YgiT family protein